MSGIRSSRRFRVLAVTALFVSAACSSSTVATPTVSPGNVSPSAAGCSAPQAGQFDFWIGSWKGTWTDNQGTATATDVVARNGCEIDETFSAARFLQHDNYSATSKSTWNASLAQWVQDYSDNVGERSRWLGGFAGGAMTLIGPQVGGRQQRVVWRNIQSDRWIWEYDSSTDGTTWSSLVVVSYQRS